MDPSPGQRGHWHPSLRTRLGAGMTIGQIASTNRPNRGTAPAAQGSPLMSCLAQARRGLPRPLCQVFERVSPAARLSWPCRQIGGESVIGDQRILQQSLDCRAAFQPGQIASPSNCRNAVPTPLGRVASRQHNLWPLVLPHSLPVVGDCSASIRRSASHGTPFRKSAMSLKKRKGPKFRHMRPSPTQLTPPHVWAMRHEREVALRNLNRVEFRQAAHGLRRTLPLGGWVAVRPLLSCRPKVRYQHGRTRPDLE